MSDISHLLTVYAGAGKVFEGISSLEGLNHWWAKTAEGEPALGATYRFYFGQHYNWKAIVTKFKTGKEFELEMTEADLDWLGTKVGFLLNPTNKGTQVEFYHSGWLENNEHYRNSSFCWAMYLRILKRYLELGEQVPYEERLNV
jgi:uncharacterized protein YndB with AHSA1/START domain